MPKAGGAGAAGGMFPQAGLTLSGGTLYGTTRGADPNSPVPVVSQGWGTVFKVNIDGTGYKDLYTFTPLSGTTNSDGIYPVAELLLCKNTLYGTASSGGAYGDGTVFAVNPDGTAFKTLHSFSSSSDGAGPVAGLFLSVDSLYGTTRWGGAWGNGVIFALTTNGSTFMIIHSFSATSVVYPYINSDGAYPVGGLTVVGNTLYGTTRGGGLSGNGTLFMVETDGTGFQTVYNFSRSSPDASGDPTNTDGTFPGAGVILSGNVLYGTASAGGSWGLGTVFSVSLPQSLTIVPSGTSIVLSWPVNTSSFTLQSTTNLMSPSWSTVPAVPIVINGQNTVTNPLSSTQQFFRLEQ